jgi:general secretion pathway protein G
VPEIASPKMPPLPSSPVIRRDDARGFTLVELLVSISIVGLLAALLLAGNAKAKSTAGASGCINNLRQLGVAASLYAADNQGDLPPAAFVNMLLPYGEGRSEMFWCPADNRPRAWKAEGKIAGSSTTSYAYNADLIGLATQANRWGSQCWVRARTLPFEIEKPPTKILFLDATNYYARRLNQFASFRHDKGLNIAYVDGHVARFTGTPEDLYQDINWVAAP